MSYDLKSAVKKVSVKPIAFALVEGTKLHMPVFAPTSVILKEVQATCGTGKVTAKGICVLEGTTIVFKTKDAPKPAWTASVKRGFTEQKAPVPVYEFRQLAEGESDQIEGDGMDPGTGQAVSPAVAKPIKQTAPIKSPLPTAVKSATPAPARTSPPQPAPTAKPAATTTPVGAKTAPPVAPKPSGPVSLAQQAKAAFDKRFKSILPRSKKKLASAEAEAEKERLFKEAGSKAVGKDWEFAQAALDDLESLVGVDVSEDAVAETPVDPFDGWEAPLLADGVESLHDLSKLLSPKTARNTAAAKEVGTRLVKDDGALDETVFDVLLKEVEAFPESPNRKQLQKTLNRLKKDPALRDKITAIEKPDPKNPATSFIRSTLGLKEGEEVTAAHARQAALSALTAELRQSDVGSCFGTSISIRIHDQQPERFLEDIAMLMKTGKLTRVVDGKTIEIPISPKMSPKRIEQRIQLDRASGKVGKSAAAVHETPPFAAALEALGIDTDKREEVLKKAVSSVSNSKAGRIKAAIEKLPKEVTGEDRLKLAAEALEALRDAPDEDAKKILTEVIKSLSPEQQKAATDGYDGHDQEPADDVSPAEILRAIAMERHGLTEKDLLLREKMLALSPKVRALQGDTSGASQSVFDEYSKVSDAVMAKRSAHEQFVKEIEASQEHYLSQQDNRLLRAWEYTVSSMAEKGVAQRQTTKLNRVATKTVNAELDQIVSKAKRKPGITKEAADAIAEAAPKLKAKYAELYKSRIQTGYDSSMKAPPSSDGSSSKGGFAMYDTTGASDANDWIRIGDEHAYADVVSGLMMDAWFQLYGNSDNAELKKESRELANQLAESARSAGFIKATLDNTEKEYPDRNAKPWAVPAGNFSKNILPVYYGKDEAVTIAEKNPADSKELLEFLVGTTKSAWSGIKDGVDADPDGASLPLGCGPHAFLMRPGSPKLKAAVESGEDASAWTAKQIEADKQKSKGRRETKLSASIRDALLEEVVGKSKKKKPLIKAIKDKLGPDASVADFQKALKDSIAEPNDQERYQKRMNTGLLKLVMPPVDSAELEATMDKVLNKLGVPDEKRKAVKDRARTRALADGATEASMREIEKAVSVALKREGVRESETESAKEVFEALRGLIEPPGIVFADSNWGGGDHHTVFSMVTNPTTDELEMWKMNEDGSDPAPLDTEKWVKSRWEMATTPAEFGGV